MIIESILFALGLFSAYTRLLKRIYGKKLKPDPITGKYKSQGDLLKIIHYAILALHYGGHGETYTEQNK